MSVISIVVPVYNTFEFLPECLDSLLAQTFEDFELILVDDGSTDASRGLCEKYADKDNRIVLVTKKNEGVSSARNEGLSIAKGRYICFVDSDDYVHPQYLQQLLELIEMTNDSLVVCGYSFQSKKRWFSQALPSKKRISIDKIRNNIAQYGTNIITHTPCNKLYRLEILKHHNIRFRLNLKIGEDWDFNIKYLFNCETITCTEQVLYYYRENLTSATARSQLGFIQQNKSVLSETMEFFSPSPAADLSFYLLKQWAYMYETAQRTMDKATRTSVLREISKDPFYTKCRSGLQGIPVKSLGFALAHRLLPKWLFTSGIWQWMLATSLGK